MASTGAAAACWDLSPELCTVSYSIKVNWDDLERWTLYNMKHLTSQLLTYWIFTIKIVHELHENLLLH